jgi:hypothetical protein
MKITDISKYNFPEISGTSQKKTVEPQGIKNGEIQDKYQKGLNVQDVTYSPSPSNTGKVPLLTQEEKEFFGNLYPKSSNQINSYQVFDSKTNSIIGQLIDKKG